MGVAGVRGGWVGGRLARGAGTGVPCSGGCRRFVVCGGCARSRLCAGCGRVPLLVVCVCAGACPVVCAVGLVWAGQVWGDILCTSGSASTGVRGRVFLGLACRLGTCRTGSVCILLSPLRLVLLRRCMLPLFGISRTCAARLRMVGKRANAVVWRTLRGRGWVVYGRCLAGMGYGGRGGRGRALAWAHRYCLCLVVPLCGGWSCLVCRGGLCLLCRAGLC